MSDLAIGRDGDAEGAFRPRTIAIMVALGVFGFLGMLVLGAYAPDLRSGHNGGAHALSNAAVGYSGLVRLAAETGRNPVILRDERALDWEGLVVLAPEPFGRDYGDVLADRRVKPTLVILPKWETEADKDHRGWVRFSGVISHWFAQIPALPAAQVQVLRVRSGGLPLVSTDTLPASVRFHAPRPLQTIAGKGLKPLVTDREGRIVLAQVGDRPLFILADPDLLSNWGLKDPGQARSALSLLDSLNSTDDVSIGFDVTLNGLGRGKSLLKLAFEPPFLALTLALGAAALLAGLHALGRFGPALRPDRAIAFGKVALVDNAAALVRMARREHRLGDRYAQVVRDQAVAAFGVPARLRDLELDGYLDRLGRRRQFSTLTAALGQARDRHELLAAARALHGWLKEEVA